MITKTFKRIKSTEIYEDMEMAKNLIHCNLRNDIVNELATLGFGMNSSSLDWYNIITTIGHVTKKKSKVISTYYEYTAEVQVTIDFHFH